VDYLSNTLVPTLPDGLGVEVFNSGALEELSTFGLTNKELEHVTYGVHTRPETFWRKTSLTIPISFKIGGL
jgi:spore coat polysaccharide biosynthesis protein SpsF (cytidylyltransferase family)